MVSRDREFLQGGAPRINAGCVEGRTEVENRRPVEERPRPARGPTPAPRGMNGRTAERLVGHTAFTPQVAEPHEVWLPRSQPAEQDGKPHGQTGFAIGAEQAEAECGIVDVEREHLPRQQ